RSALFSSSHTATTVPYPLSLHDALPIFSGRSSANLGAKETHASAAYTLTDKLPQLMLIPLFRSVRDTCSPTTCRAARTSCPGPADRKSTRLNSSHVKISYAVFCLKKKNK